MYTDENVIDKLSVRYYGHINFGSTINNTKPKNFDIFQMDAKKNTMYNFQWSFYIASS